MGETNKQLKDERWTFEVNFPNGLKMEFPPEVRSSDFSVGNRRPKLHIEFEDKDDSVARWLESWAVPTDSPFNYLTLYL